MGRLAARPYCLQLCFKPVDPKKQRLSLSGDRVLKSWWSTLRTKNSIWTLGSASSTTPPPAAPLGSGPARASSCAAKENTSSVGSASTLRATGRSGTTFSDVRGVFHVNHTRISRFQYSSSEPSHDITCRYSSFLYFRSDTVFTQTGFVGRPPLREDLSDSERYARRLASGFDRGFSGFATLTRLHPNPPDCWEGKHEAVQWRDISWQDRSCSFSLP